MPWYPVPRLSSPLPQALPAGMKVPLLTWQLDWVRTSGRPSDQGSAASPAVDDGVTGAVSGNRLMKTEHQVPIPTLCGVSDVTSTRSLLA